MKSGESCKMELSQKVSIALLSVACLTGSFLLGKDHGKQVGRDEVVNAITTYHVVNLDKSTNFPQEVIESAREGSEILGEIRTTAYSRAFPQYFSVRDH